MHLYLNRSTFAARLLVCLVIAFTLAQALAWAADPDLAYYSDTFETLNEDNWGRAQYTHNEAQLKNFILGELEIADNRLHMRTKPGAFSKAGLNGRYVFRGDFDIQIDCHFDFKRLVRGMDQYVNFGVSNKPEHSEAWWVALIKLEQRANRRPPRISFLSVKNRKAVVSKHMDTGDFHGTLRFVREGKKLTGIFRRESSGRWHTLGYTLHFTSEDVFVGFVVQNFQTKRKSIDATDSIEVVFDNFKINHADAIIEDEI